MHKYDGRPREREREREKEWGRERAISLTHSPVEGILGVRCVVVRPVQLQAVGLVLRPQQWRLLPVGVRTHVEVVDAERLMLASHVPFLDRLHERLPRATLVLAAPDPRVAVPQRRQEVNPSCLGPAVGSRNANEDIHRAGFGILGIDVPVLALVEDASILQLKLRLLDSSPLVLLHQPAVGVGRLRVLVQGLHVGVRGGGVQVVVALLRVLAVVALRPRQPEDALLEDGVLLVPECEGEAEAALSVADAQQPILPPPVGPGAGVVMREVIPAAHTYMQHIVIISILHVTCKYNVELHMQCSLHNV